MEISRGCPFSCFCTEPHVKGRTTRYCDLDVIEADLDYLVCRQIRRFLADLLGAGHPGDRFGLALAERIVRLREPS